MKKIIQYAALALLLLVFPLGSYLWMKSGFNQQVKHLKHLEPKGEVPTFSFLTTAGDSLLPKTLQGSPHAVHFFSDDKLSLELLHQISLQFKDKDVHVISYLPEANYDYASILKKYDIEVDRKKSNWHFVAPPEGMTQTQLYDMYQLPENEKNKLLIVGKDMNIRGYYDINKDEFDDTMIHHMALMLPRDKKKEIGFKRKTEK